MRQLRLGLVLLLGFAACGGSPMSSSSPTAASPHARFEVAGSTPSASARMVCATEGKEEIAASVGVDTVRPLAGQWRQHVYSCVYAYGGGRSMTLSVKELSSEPATRAYFDRLGVELGRGRLLQGLGQGAFQTRNGSTVVRKDDLVLLVDDSRLPAEFGTPSSARADVSLSVAATIMGCWTGA